MKTINEMRKEIKEKYSAIPEKQISSGIYLHTIGRKYVTIINTWNRTKFEKIALDDFYDGHC
jgi:hypothetical protein